MTPRRSLGAFVAVATTLFLGGVVYADAPHAQYATFFRTDTCITDQLTHLTWIRAPIMAPSPGQSALTFGDAATQCAGLGAGWRVPSVNELETLVDEVPHFELEGGRLTSKAIDANAFPSTPAGTAYWTSSVVPGGVKAWLVEFQTGTTSTAVQTESHPVRCVNASPPTSFCAH